MFLQGRVIIVWLSWLVGGICGVIILLIIICYCRLMPRHQKSFDEQYLKENYTIKEGHGYTNQDNFRVSKHNEVSVQVQRHARPASYAGDGECRRGRSAHSTHNTHAAHNTHTAHTHTSHSYVNRVPDSPRDHPAHASYTHHAAATAVQYASSGMLDEVEAAGGGGGAGSSASMDALKTRSLPAFLRPKPRPLSTEDDLHQLYAKVNLSKKYKKRMRSEHAAIIALSKSHSQFFDADAVIVYDQRTEL